MGNRCIDHHHPDGNERNKGPKFHPLCNRTANNGHGNNRKGHLEDHKQNFRNGATQGIGGNTGQHELVQAANKGIAFAKGQGIANNYPDQTDHCGRNKTVRHGAEDVFLAHHTAIEQGQARNGHE